jgi:hypothetical protein
LGLAFAACLSLAACSDTEGEANKEYVAISSELAAVAAISDPIAKYEKLEELEKRVDALKAKYAQTNVAVKLASDEKVGPYRPSEILQELAKLKKDPAFCMRSPTPECTAALISDHEKTIADKDKLRASAFRLTTAMRLGDTAKATAILQQAQDAGRAGGERMIPPTLALPLFAADMTKSGDFWQQASQVADIVSLARMFSGQKIPEKLFASALDGRVVLAGDYETIKRLIDIAAARKESPELLTNTLDHFRWLASDQLTEAEAAKVLAVWPPDHLPQLLGQYEAGPLWKALDKSKRDAVLAAWPKGKLNDIPWSAREFLTADFLKARLKENPDGYNTGFLVRTLLGQFGNGMDPGEFVTIVGKVPEDDRRPMLIQGIMDRMFKKPDDAVILADYMAALPTRQTEEFWRNGYRQGGELWAKMARATTPKQARDYIKEAVSTTDIWDELTLIGLAKQHPEIISPDDLVDFSFVWGDRFYPHGDATVTNYFDSLSMAIVGRYAINGVGDQAVKRYFETLLTKPYLNRSRLLIRDGYDDVVKRGLTDVAQKMQAAVLNSRDWLGQRDYYFGEAEAASKKDAAAMTIAYSAIPQGDRSQFLTWYVVRQLDNPVKASLWDYVLNNDPKDAALALGDRVPFASRASLEIAYSKLPAAFDKLAASDPRGALMAEYAYVHWLWAIEDRKRLEEIVFKPANIDPAIWYMAVDALVGIERKSPS